MAFSFTKRSSTGRCVSVSIVPPSAGELQGEIGFGKGETLLAR